MTRILKMVPLAFLALSACGGGGGGSGSSSSNNSGGQTSRTFDVTPCLTQAVPGTVSITKPGQPSLVADLVVPDVLGLDMTRASGFPNGRLLADPVIDIELAALLLDLKANPNGAATFAKMPLNPAGNDVPLRTTFPYLGVAQGSAPAPIAGADYVFRTDAPSAYTRVDRMGFPAVATALVRTAQKNFYNDDNPAVDATGKWVKEFNDDLTETTAPIYDQIKALNLVPCAKVS